MNNLWKPKELLVKRDLAFDVLLCSVTNVQRRLEKYGANTSVHVQF